MAEFRDFSSNQDSVNERERDAVILEEFPNELSFDVLQNLELDENMLENIANGRIRHENNLIILTFELKNVTIYLQELQLKLLDLKHDKLKKDLNKCVDGLNSLILKFQNLWERIENDDNETIEKYESPSFGNKEPGNFATAFSDFKDDDYDKLLDEMYGDFLRYNYAYRKCAFHVETFLHKADTFLKIDNVPRESQEALCVLLSVLEENLDSYKKMFISSKEEFQKFEMVFTCGFKSFIPNTTNRINYFIATIKTAELAYTKLKPLLFDILQFDCALRV